MLHSLKTKNCVIVFLLSLCIGYIGIPKDVFDSPYAFIAVLFIIAFSLTMTCIVRSMKERFSASRATHASLVGTFASFVGLSALQVCGAGAAMCGATMETGIVSIIFPSVLYHFLREYSIGFSRDRSFFNRLRFGI